MNWYNVKQHIMNGLDMSKLLKLLVNPEVDIEIKRELIKQNYDEVVGNFGEDKIKELLEVPESSLLAFAEDFIEFKVGMFTKLSEALNVVEQYDSEIEEFEKKESKQIITNRHHRHIKDILEDFTYQFNHSEQPQSELKRLAELIVLKGLKDKSTSAIPRGKGNIGRLVKLVQVTLQNYTSYHSIFIDSLCRNNVVNNKQRREIKDQLASLNFTSEAFIKLVYSLTSKQLLYSFSNVELTAAELKTLEQQPEKNLVLKLFESEVFVESRRYADEGLPYYDDLYFNILPEQGLQL